MKKTILFIFIFSTFLINSQTKSFKNLDEVKNNTKQIANSFINKKYEDLFNSLRPYWGVKSSEIDTLATKTASFQSYFDQRLGKSIDAIKVKEQNLEDALFSETYFLRYQNSALRIKLIYYNNGSGWVVNSFNWDDKFIDELD